MSYLGVQDWFQIQMRKMEEFNEKENAVRFVYAFVEQLELDKLSVISFIIFILSSNVLFEASAIVV
jgi:hypothetical protein